MIKKIVAANRCTFALSCLGDRDALVQASYRWVDFIYCMLPPMWDRPDAKNIITKYELSGMARQEFEQNKESTLSIKVLVNKNTKVVLYSMFDVTKDHENPFFQYEDKF